MTELTVVHGLTRNRLAAPQWTAQLAHDQGVLVEMHALPDERRAPAVGAAVAVRRQRPDAPAQQLALEQLGVDREGAFAHH